MGRKFLISAVYFVLLGVLYHFTSEFCNSKTDGFSVVRIYSDLPYNPSWETAPIDAQKRAQLNALFAQRFFYLGCGGQCFAFASEDGQYVIKFFKHKIRKPLRFLYEMPLPLFLQEKQKKKLNKALFKTNRDFTSYKLAYERLPEETGLLYVHLNKGTDLGQSVVIVDKIGIAHTISLDEVEFVVQKKGELAYEKMRVWIEKGELASAQKALHEILSLIVTRCKKGVYDEDPRVHRNLGFVGERPFFIDVGRFIPDANRTRPEVYRRDLKAVEKQLREWLEESYPTLVPLLSEHAYECES